VPPDPEALRARIAAIHREIAALDLVARGTLVRRTKVCGKPSCRCATDPNARHGPYFEWGRLEQGRRTSTTISPEKARRLVAALRNHRRLRTLLRRWERESARAIDASDDASHGQDRT
jgi:hypothetical protein